MPLEHLLSALEREAGEQVHAILAAARAAAAAIAREAEERLGHQRSDVLGAREAELRGAAEAALDEARRAARAGVLEARARLLDRVFAAAREQLPAALASEAYRAALPGHVAEALRAMGDEPTVIRCPAALVPAVRAAVQRKETAVRSDPAAGSGVTAVATDGTIEVDNTLEGRLERLKPRLALEVLARLKGAS